jgi:hypothetical protein
MRHNDIPDDVVAIFLTCRGTVQNVEVHFAVAWKTSPYSDTSATKSEWSRDHRNWNLRQWRRVHWSDESRFILHHIDGRMRVWRPKNTAYREQHILGTTAFGGGGVTVWGCFSMWCRMNLLSSDQWTLRHCLKFQLRWSRDHWCRVWRCLRVNKGFLIGLRAFKRAQLSLKITVRTLTRPWIAQLSRNRRAVENGRRRADYDSVLSSLS